MGVDLLATVRKTKHDEEDVTKVDFEEYEVSAVHLGDLVEQIAK
jgi:hypothetical protein